MLLITSILPLMALFVIYKSCDSASVESPRPAPPAGELPLFHLSLCPKCEGNNVAGSGIPNKRRTRELAREQTEIGGTKNSASLRFVKCPNGSCDKKQASEQPSKDNKIYKKV